MSANKLAHIPTSATRVYKAEKTVPLLESMMSSSGMALGHSTILTNI